MKLTPTARLAVSCAVFISVLFFSSSPDLSLTLAISAYFLLNKKKKNYYYFFISSILVFIFNWLFELFDWPLKLINNLAWDAYCLFITGVILYLRTREDFLKLIRRFLEKETKLKSKDFLMHVVASTVVALLLYPLLGGFLSSVTGYLLLSFLIREQNGKIAVIISLVILFLAMLSILLKKPELAENLGNYTFLFLVIGTLQEIIKLTGLRFYRPFKKNEEDTVHARSVNAAYEETVIEEESITTFENKKGILESESFSMKRLEIQPLKAKGIFFVKFRKLFLSLTIAAVIIMAGYFLYPQIKLLKFKLPKIPDIKLAKMFKAPKKVIPTPTPTVITPTPTAEPTPTVVPVAKITDEVSILKIMVQNGTDIRGLAATTAAKLKEAGFKNIETGNREGDYLNWEVAVKDNKEDFTPLFQDILKLSDMKSSQASVPAGFDILIIAGVNP